MGSALKMSIATLILEVKFFNFFKLKNLKKSKKSNFTLTSLV